MSGSGGGLGPGLALQAAGSLRPNGEPGVTDGAAAVDAAAVRAVVDALERGTDLGPLALRRLQQGVLAVLVDEVGRVVARVLVDVAELGAVTGALVRQRRRRGVELVQHLLELLSRVLHVHGCSSL